MLGVEMPVFPKRRFQQGAVASGKTSLFARDESLYRRQFQTLHASLA